MGADLACESTVLFLGAAGGGSHSPGETERPLTRENNSLVDLKSFL